MNATLHEVTYFTSTATHAMCKSLPAQCQNQSMANGQHAKMKPPNHCKETIMIDVTLANPTGVLPVETQQMLAPQSTDVYLGQNGDFNPPPPPLR
jgi:hypothetical protein